MPYIHVQSYPKDEETVKEVTERINQIFLELWGCPQDAITIRMEQMPPEEWDEKVLKGVIEPNKDKMMICGGKKQY